MVTVNVITLFADLKSILWGSGEVVFGQSIGGPLQGVLEAVLDHADACQLQFYLGYHKQVYWRQIQKKWPVGDHLDGFGSQLGLQIGGAVNECIVSVSKWVLKGQNGPLLPKDFYILAQGLCDVGCIDGLVLVHIVGVIELLWVNEGKGHHFCLDCLPIGLYLALLKHCLDNCFI